MKQLLLRILCLIVSVPAFSQHPLIDRICQKQNEQDICHSWIEFRVFQPMTDEEVIYSLQSICQKTDQDSLSPYAYYIEVDSASHPSAKGNFSTYFDGHYYDFSNERLREYHMPKDSASFYPMVFRGRKTAGVHESGLFTGEIPLKSAEMLRSFLQDSCCQIEERPADPNNGRPYDEIRVRRYRQGELVRSIDLSFDPVSGLPLQKEIENSPNKVGAQTVVTVYRYPQEMPVLPTDFFSEARLLRDKKEILSEYRTSDYRIDGMKGKKIQPFSLQELNETKRFDSQSIEGKPAILAFVKTDCSFCDSTLRVLNELNGELTEPKTVQKIALYTDKLPQEIEPEIETQSFSGRVLYNAGNIALHYGVHAYPTLFIVSPAGEIIKIQSGYVRNLKRLLAETLTQKNN